MSLNTFITRLLIFITLCFCGLTIYFYLFIPDTTKLKDFLYEINNSERFIPAEKIPTHVKKAFIVAEDNFFHIHQGVDYLALIRAAKVLLATGEKKYGGSTITMQLARNVYLHKRKTFTRKFNEILLAYKIEQAFTKDQILSMYLNIIYFGHNNYGIKEASSFYFGKDVLNLSAAEGATLASIPPAPGYTTPILKPQKILYKRNTILVSLLTLNHISPPEYCKAFASPLLIDKK
ncbi:MAG: transglycosylase domain-containing protein [Gammaproteobacteria bacterium]|nr:transglycosylase domain-containing protein [Gammaproteobacteria bacterium]